MQIYSKRKWDFIGTGESILLMKKIKFSMKPLLILYKIAQSKKEFWNTKEA